MQSVSSRIWIRVAVSISYDDNHYTTATSFYLVLMLCYVYVIVIYDGVCVEDTVWKLISNTHENMANIMSTDCGSAWKRI